MSHSGPHFRDMAETKLQFVKTFLAIFMDLLVNNPCLVIAPRRLVIIKTTVYRRGAYQSFGVAHLPPTTQAYFYVDLRGGILTLKNWLIPRLPTPPFVFVW